MRIAVVTLHRIHNYGSVLQAYATQQILERMGHEVRVVDYITPQRTLRRRLAARPSGAGKGVKGALLHVARMASVLMRDITFGRFIQRNLKLTRRYITPEELQKDPPVADLYVTGSDQVWNSDYNEGVDRGFFLDFVPEESRRLAFCASFGKSELRKEEKAQIARYVNRYEALSVREDSARNILEDMGCRDVEWLIDPTLQLRREAWLSMAVPRLFKEPYVLLMLLYGEDRGATEYARRIADARGVKLLKLSWEMVKPKAVDVLMTHRTPEEFLSLFAHAEFIVTNSFHGLAFAINLERPFMVVPRNEFNSRIESLLRLTGLQERMITGGDCLEIAARTMDFAPVRKVLEQERERAQAYLKAHVSQEDA